MNDKENILALLQEGLDREKQVLSFWLCKNQKERDRQDWIILWIELAISWIENNINSQ